MTVVGVEIDPVPIPGPRRRVLLTGPFRDLAGSAAVGVDGPDAQGAVSAPHIKRNPATIWRPGWRALAPRATRQLARTGAVRRGEPDVEFLARARRGEHKLGAVGRKLRLDVPEG